MNILKTIGNTPLIEVQGVFAKLETVNPSGSIKDRMAKFMVERAEKTGKLKPGYRIIEATSGNTGVSFSLVSAVKGYKFTAVVHESTSSGKKDLMRLLGAELVLVPDEWGFPELIAKTEELARERRRKVWLPKQFANPDNVEAHRLGMGREIARQTKKIDALVAGIGTGGTLMGAAKALRAKFPKIKIFGVEPAESHHQIEGISDGIVPDILEERLIDGMIKVKSRDALRTARKLAEEHGLLVGISSGANFMAARQLKRKYQNVVTVFPDRAERYLEKL